MQQERSATTKLEPAVKRPTPSVLWRMHKVDGVPMNVICKRYEMPLGRLKKTLEAVELFAEKNFAKDIQTLRMIQFMRFDALYKSLKEQWDKSRTDYHKINSKTERMRRQLADAKLAAEMRFVLSEQCKLLGLYAPTEVKSHVTVDGPPMVEIIVQNRAELAHVRDILNVDHRCLDAPQPAEFPDDAIDVEPSSDDAA